MVAPTRSLDPSVTRAKRNNFGYSTIRPKTARIALSFVTRQVLSRDQLSNGRWHHVWPVIASQFRNRTDAG